MKKWLGVFALAAAIGGAQAAPTVKNESFLDATGLRVLKESVVVNASPAQAWAAFTSDAAFLKWSGVPVAHITPGNDGLIEFGLTPASKIGDPQNVRNRILVYQPNALLIWRNEFVPAGGPLDPPTFATVRTMVSFDAQADGTTKVTETVVGFGTGAKYDDLYEHLRGGNAEYLTLLSVYLANTYFTRK